VEQRINSKISGFVFDWKKIIKNSTFSEPETVDTIELQRVHMAPDNLIKTRGDVDVNLEVKASEIVQDTSNCVKDPVEELTEILQACDNNDEMTVVAKYYEPSGSEGNMEPEQRESLLEAAIIFSPLDLRQQLQRWWDSVSWEVRHFWRSLELQSAI
jgi:hypothetical protein